MIVGTGGAAVPLQLGEPLKSWVLGPDLDKSRRMGSRESVGAAVDTIVGQGPLTRSAPTTSPLTTATALPSPCATSAGTARAGRAAAANHTSVTLLNGRDDRVVLLANVEFLDERLPNSRVVIIDAGHFVWEEAPAEYASIVLAAIARRLGLGVQG